jgi:O-antigen ligase
MEQIAIPLIVFFSLCIGLVIPTPVRIYVLAVLSVPQIYVGNNSISLFDIWLLVTTMLSVKGTYKPGRDARLLKPIWLLVLTFIFAFLWSDQAAVPSSILWITRITLFGLLAQILSHLKRTNPIILYRAIYYTLPGLMLQSLLIIYFQSNPAIETYFLRSPLSNTFVGPAAMALFSDFKNNVLDPAKSGGLMVNANAASMVAGVGLCLTLILLNRRGAKWLIFPVFIEIYSIFLTGSKTGSSLLVCLALVALALSTPVNPMKKMFALVSAITLGLLGSNTLPNLIPGVNDSTQGSFGTRIDIWKVAFEMFQVNPLLGLGFGGWQRDIALYPSARGYPPHNLFVLAWANAGLVATLLVAIFMYRVTADFLDLIRIYPVSRVRNEIIFAFLALAWIFLHGLGDNTFIFGEIHSLFLAAMCLSFLSGALSKKNAEEKMHSNKVGDSKLVE